MNRWVGLLVLLSLFVGGCAPGMKADSGSGSPQSFQKKPTEGNGGGGY